MAFEREAIAATPLANPNLPPTQMREEYVVDPYKISGPSPKPRSAENIEAKPEESKVPVESVTLSPAAAAIARKEQKLRQAELKFKAEQESLSAERREIAELKALKAQLLAEDYSGVESQIPYDKYVNYLINKGQATTPEQTEMKAIRAELDAEKKARQADVDQRFEAAVSERRKAVSQLVETDPEFSTIKEKKMEDAVVQHILDSWEHDNIDLDPKQAAKEVEDILLETAREWTSISKLKVREESPVEEKRELPPLKSAVKTLTNNMAPVGEIARLRRSFEGMSDGERYAEARRRAEEKIKAGLA